MTKQDYELLVKAITNARLGVSEREQDAVDTTARHIALVLQQDNERFVREIFLEKCGVADADAR